MLGCDMRTLSSGLAAAAMCLLSACTTALHGQQSSSGGAGTTTTGSFVAGSASAGGGRIAFSSGSAPAPGAAGGQAALGRGATAVLFLGLVVADTLDFLAARLGGATPAAAVEPLPASISHTCSCYGYKPEAGDK
jgi:hypothetical protein